MNERSALVLARYRERQPSARLRAECRPYGVAADALDIVRDLQCDGRIEDAIWSLVLREQDAYLAKARVPA